MPDVGVDLGVVAYLPRPFSLSVYIGVAMCDPVHNVNIMQTCKCNVYPPYTPLLYSKTGVYTGMHFSSPEPKAHR